MPTDIWGNPFPGSSGGLAPPTPETVLNIGEFVNYNTLITVSPANPTLLNRVAYVQNSTGIYLINRKYKGWYVCDGTTWSFWEGDDLSQDMLAVHISADDHNQYFNETRGDARYEKLANKSNDPTMAGDSSSAYVTEHAAKSYTDAKTITLTKDVVGSGTGSFDTTLVKASSTFAFTGMITPVQITADQNDYNPAGLSTASVLRLSTNASRNITGLAGGADGRILTVMNFGSFDIVLVDSSVSSSAANRFAMGRDRTIRPNNCVVLMYDSITSLWKMIASSIIYDSWLLVGGVQNVGGNATSLALYSSAGVNGGIVAFKAGKIIGLSIVLNNARTAGTCTFQVLINGVAQTGSGQTLVIDSTNTTTNRRIYTLTQIINYAAGDIIQLQTVTASFTPTGADATLVAFLEDT